MKFIGGAAAREQYSFLESAPGYYASEDFSPRFLQIYQHGGGGTHVLQDFALLRLPLITSTSIVFFLERREFKFFMQNSVSVMY